MTYWQMQLHPNDPNFNREREILEQKRVIGLDDNGQIAQFQQVMRIGDIVLIKRGSQPLALVEVTGEPEFIHEVNQDLDWFPHRRNIKVLAFMDEVISDFPSPKSTLTKSVNRYTPTYQYINQWCHRVIAPDFNRQGLKIRTLYINNYKMFHDFKLNFFDKEYKLPAVTILAGINGSGKTTLLEYLSGFDTSPKFDGEEYIEIYLNGEPLTIYKDSKKKQTNGIREYKSGVIYCAVDFGNIIDLETKIKSYIDELMFERDFKASEAYGELRNNINEIFAELNLTISFSGLDRNKAIYFENQKGERFGIDALSTGEKTLLTKVLYLYLSEIKNRIILIDEPELSLHPTWQNNILQLYENFADKNNNQILLATHSPHILASAKSNSIRLLNLNKGKVEIFDSFDHCYGLEFSKILTDIMGVKHLRTPKVEAQLGTIKELIASDQFKTERFQSLWQYLEKHLGSKDVDLNLLALEMHNREKNVIGVSTDFSKR
jgi:predicted ATP-binding protein involved in virulence